MIGDPADPAYRVEGLTLPGDVPPLRLQSRRSLLAQVEEHLAGVERSGALDLYDHQAQDAFGLLSSPAARAAFDLGLEPERLRERYGPGKWGPCLLLARRLVEAGVRLVHVNWPRETGDTAIDNPMWDTHAQNSDRLQDVLCPQFDVSFTTLIDDLDARGLLAETLVVVIGEFGRTPKINNKGGRDHWGHVFSFALAGAGIRAGQVYGSSDAHGAFPRSDKVEPQNLTATIFHLLGIGHDAFFADQTGRPRRVTEGKPLATLLGSRPATLERRTPGGDPASVPPFSDNLLLNPSFADHAPLGRVGSRSRLRGWQAEPIAASSDFGVRLIAADRDGTGVRIGFDPGAGSVAPGVRALLTQEIRNPRAGRYTLSVRSRTVGSPAGIAAYLEAFSFRLVILGYQNPKKDPREAREFASTPFVPAADGAPREFTLAVALKSQDENAYQLSQGVAVAVVVERRGPLPLAPDPSSRAHLCIEGVTVTFDPRPRNDDVTV
jgi:hypothetical protein